MRLINLIVLLIIILYKKLNLNKKEMIYFIKILYGSKGFH
jgi:hypothetical protein